MHRASLAALTLYHPLWWSNECQAGFEATKIRAALLQGDEHYVGHAICYFSQKFKKRQLHYSTTENVLALQHFRVYLGSSPIPIIVFSDYIPLVFLSHMQIPYVQVFVTPRLQH